MTRCLHVALAVLIVGVGSSAAQPVPEPVPDVAPEPAPEPAPVPVPVPPPAEPEPAAPVIDAPALSSIQIHGFVSNGAFVSTANDYIGKSSRGSIELFEAGINVSKTLGDRLRAGLQFFGRDVGAFSDLPPRLDWAFLDYRWKPFLGLRAGIIKMPFGLHNEYADIDAARLTILIPQSVYPLRNRSALLAHTGFALYGQHELGSAGGLEYQTWIGTLNIPENALTINNAKLDEIDTKYIAGGQVFWSTPLEGLRVGATYLRASIDFRLTLDPALVAALVMAGLVPADYDGKLVISQQPLSSWIASAEYIRGDWRFLAEYNRGYTRQSTDPEIQATLKRDTEGFYALAARRFGRLEAGAYYSVLHADANDRRGRDEMKFPERWYAWQRDASVTLRYDVTDHWLWKVEAHFIDGVADLPAADNPDPKRFWGLFLIKTTVTF